MKIRSEDTVCSVYFRSVSTYFDLSIALTCIAVSSDRTRLTHLVSPMLDLTDLLDSLLVQAKQHCIWLLVLAMPRA